MVAAAAVWLYHASGCSRLVAWVANSGEWVEAKWLKMLGGAARALSLSLELLLSSARAYLAF
eukprot:6874882-Prymnesium_polylepis.1